MLTDILKFPYFPNFDKISYIHDYILFKCSFRMRLYIYIYKITISIYLVMIVRMIPAVPRFQEHIMGTITTIELFSFNLDQIGYVLLLANSYILECIIILLKIYIQNLIKI